MDCALFICFFSAHLQRFQKRCHQLRIEHLEMQLETCDAVDDVCQAIAVGELSFGDIELQMRDARQLLQPLRCLSISDEDEANNVKYQDEIADHFQSQTVYTWMRGLG